MHLLYFMKMLAIYFMASSLEVQVSHVQNLLTLSSVAHTVWNHLCPKYPLAGVLYLDILHHWNFFWILLNLFHNSRCWAWCINFIFFMEYMNEAYLYASWSLKKFLGIQVWQLQRLVAVFLNLGTKKWIW